MKFKKSQLKNGYFWGTAILVGLASLSTVASYGAMIDPRLNAIPRMVNPTVEEASKAVNYCWQRGVKTHNNKVITFQNEIQEAGSDDTFEQAVLVN